VRLYLFMQANVPFDQFSSWDQPRWNAINEIHPVSSATPTVASP
jgi:hypothetical protein